MKAEYVFRTTEGFLKEETLNLLIQNAMHFALNRKKEGLDVVKVDGPYAKENNGLTEYMFLVKVKEQ